jgi:hypothetical protein
VLLLAKGGLEALAGVRLLVVEDLVVEDLVVEDLVVEALVVEALVAEALVVERRLDGVAVVIDRPRETTGVRLYP